MNISKPKIWVIWQWGAVGVKLNSLLKQHPVLKNCLSEVTWGLSSLEWGKWKEAIAEILVDNDIVVLCIHDDIAKEIINIKKKVNSITKIIDCSTAHRTNEEWIYWLPELKSRKEAIENAELIANPWCHSTAVILSVMPLLDDCMVELKSAIVQSTTWYSGGGKAMIQEYSKENNKPAVQYSTWIEHKHISEILDQTHLGEVIFQPEVTNYFNGLKTNTFLNLTYRGKNFSEKDVIEIFREYYKWKEFIKVSEVPDTGKISIDENNDTQNVSIYIKKHSDTIQVITVIDNMTKWAAGAVIQNLNIMLWLEEGEGL
jgi:N-acetyl-gamma-glutamyl-phosphate reductase